jgi:tetratricopeptide (TPR) repeat protein
VGVARLMPLSLLGRYDEALASGAETEAALTRHGDLQGAAKVALNLGSLAIHRGRHDEAAGHYRRAAVRFARAGDREHSVMADVGLADALGHGSRLDEAARIYDRAGMRARQHGLPVLAAQADHGRAMLALGAGRYRAALAGLVRARAAFERIGVDHYLTEVERDLADAYLDLNLLPEALAIYDRLIDRLQAQDNGATLPWLILQRARAEARAGQAQRSAAGLRKAGELFAAQAHPTGQALARLALLELCGTLVQTPEDGRTLDRPGHGHGQHAAASAAVAPDAGAGRRLATAGATRMRPCGCCRARPHRPPPAGRRRASPVVGRDRPRPAGAGRAGRRARSLRAGRAAVRAVAGGIARRGIPARRAGRPPAPLRGPAGAQPGSRSRRPRCWPGSTAIAPACWASASVAGRKTARRPTPPMPPAASSVPGCTGSAARPGAVPRTATTSCPPRCSKRPRGWSGRCWSRRGATGWRARKARCRPVPRRGAWGWTWAPCAGASSAPAR